MCGGLTCDRGLTKENDGGGRFHTDRSGSPGRLTWNLRKNTHRVVEETSLSKVYESMSMSGLHVNLPGCIHVICPGWFRGGISFGPGSS